MSQDPVESMRLMSQLLKANRDIPRNMPQIADIPETKAVKSSPSRSKRTTTHTISNNALNNINNAIRTNKESHVIKATHVSSDDLITRIIANILPPLEPVKDKRGYIIDSANILVKCQIGHIDKYLIKELAESPLSKCKTCTYGTKTEKIIRETAEQILDIAFTMIEPGLFVNPAHKIVLSCRDFDAMHHDKIVRDNIILRFQGRQTKESIMRIIYEGLHEQLLSDVIHEKLSLIQHSVKSVDIPEVYYKGRLPSLAQIPDNMYIENYICNDTYQSIEDCAVLLKSAYDFQ